MAEHKSEDTKPSAARRAARPFIGPAGATPAAPRPLQRPAGPSGRPSPAPFSPPRVPQRSTLGTPPSPEPPVAATAPLRPTTPVPAFDVIVATASRLAQPVEAAGRIDAPPATPVAPFAAASAPTEETEFSLLSTSVGGDGLTSEPDAGESAAVEPPRYRPITSEMVAIDAFAAFDAVWGPSTTPPASPIVAAVASPVDAESLGSGMDGHGPWAEEIAAAPESEMDAAEPFDQVGRADDPGTDSIDSAWTRAATPDAAMPAWLADDSDASMLVDPAPTSAEPTAADLVAAEQDASPDDGSSLEALPATEVANYEPYLGSLGGAAPTAAHDLVAPSASLLHRQRMSAALDRLAERVRGGEIDVSSVAPEAPDAAILASVLAALLGGSSSR